MSNFPILCMVCDQTIKGDEAFLLHMQSVHGTSSPDQANLNHKAVEMNTPKEIPLDKNAPPPPGFMEIAKMMDQPALPKQSPIPVPSAPQAVVVTTPAVKTQPRPIELKYQYDGDCHKCGMPVKTIMLDATAGLYAIAYCMVDNMQLKQIEVQRIVDRKEWNPTPNPQDQGKTDKSIEDYNMKLAAEAHMVEEAYEPLLEEAQYELNRTAIMKEVKAHMEKRNAKKKEVAKDGRKESKARN